MSKKSHPAKWKFSSDSSEGFHPIITPNNSPCINTWIFRLNLPAGHSYLLNGKELELNGVVIHGRISLNNETILNKLDSFYLPGGQSLHVKAICDSILYIGGSVCENKGSFFTRNYDSSIPLGDIRQIHGVHPYRREVFMTLGELDAASRLICGITIGEPGAWTSWPAHQHTKDLEEVYCYFDIPESKFAFHFSSRKSGIIEYIHPVKSGDFVIIPEGYHPTCGMPDVKSCYFWVMSAHNQSSRRYDLAINDPVYS